MSYGMLSTLAEIEDMPDGIAEQLKPLLEKLSLPGLSHYQRSCLAKDCLYLHPRIIGQENSEAIAHNDDDHHCF
ncbi:MAG TPA: hypothetical protein VE956_13600 [Nodularia sp. (in: cyanobacteria)]|nr:hypothetical protein [Nodularia sp. (in: cyanobacteria)]